MKAAVLKQAGEIVIEERPAPKVGPGEVLVRIRAYGICGSDIHGFEGKIPDRRPPGIITRLVCSVRHGERPPSTLEDAIRRQRMIEAIERSIVEGRAVKV